MSIIGNEALAGASGQAGYFIDRSLRFRSSATAYLSRTPASASNRKTWTWSAWVKRGKLSANQTLFTAGNGTYDSRTEIILDANDYLYMVSDHRSTGGTYYSFNTLARFRDPSAWYHIVVIWDTTQSTDTNRLKGYINNIQYTFNVQNVWMPQNFDGYVNSTSNHYIGKTNHNGVTHWLDGYLTEINLIDGQALDPSYFGETDLDTGVWKPKKYAGTYGTNGFYLNFKNPATTVTLCADQSGNGNNWGANNISLSAGSTYDSMQDVPTLTSEDASNFCTMNPVDKNDGSYSDGNLGIVTGTVGGSTQRGSIYFDSGKYYWEYLPISNGGISAPGFETLNNGTYTPQFYQADNGLYYNGGGTISYGATFGNNDLIGIAVDADNRTVEFFKNGVSQGLISSANSGISVGDTIIPFVSDRNVAQTTTAAINFGQRPFAYTPPTGFKKLNTYNLPTPTIKDGGDYFNISLWAGNGTSQSITNSGSMQPDFIWLKARNNGLASHRVVDAVRGLPNVLKTTATNVESTDVDVSSFNSNGFSVSGSGGGEGNESGENYVGWQWKANGSGSTNTDGSITSTVSANTSSGFSIVTFTSPGGSAPTIGHGLGTTPSLIIMKSRNNASGWNTYHASVGNTGSLNLQTTGATSTSVDWWNNTSPTASVWTIGANLNISSWTWVAYCFAPIEGYSAFGSYTGNGSADGPFVYTGFRPAFVMMKRTDTAGGSWPMIDKSRNGFNIQNYDLYANLTQAEATSSVADLLSNGFKLRGTSSEWNGSGNSYIYAAFAENPFKYSLAR